MYIVMGRHSNEQIGDMCCIYADKKEMMEQWFPFGVDENNIEKDSCMDGYEMYYIEINNELSSVIDFIIEESIKGYHGE